MRNVGLIGLGAMGLGMAQSLRRGGLAAVSGPDRRQGCGMWFGLT